ncbi:retrovirus-related pol polyprotein from transposon TNT 1-94 [Tanacetum coccineum]
MVKQYQKEVNEIRAKKIAKNANPLALIATAQPHQASKSHKSYAPTSKTSLPTRSHATTRHKGKVIAKPITLLSESASEKDNDHEQAQKDKEMLKNLALITKYKNDNQTGQFRNQRTINVAEARETVGGQVVQQSGIQFFNCKEFGHFAKECRKPKGLKTPHTDEEIDEQELEAHYSYMAKIQEVPTADSGTDSEPLEQVQYDAGYNVFANEIQHSEQPESISNTCVVETGDSNVIPDSPDMCDNDIQNDQNAVECDDERVALANLIANLKLDTEFERYKTLNDRTVDYEKLEHNHGCHNDERVALANLISNLKLDVDENKKIQKQLKKANTTLAHEFTECKSILAETSRTLEESNSIWDSCLVALQNKQTEFERYKTLNDRTVDYEKPCLYEIPHDQSDPANRLVPDREETLTLEIESRSKLNKDLVKPYDYTKLNSLYENFKPRHRNILELVDQAWVKHSKDHFRAPTAHDMEILIKTCLMPLALKTQNDSFTFVHELKQEMHADLKYVESLEKEIDELEYDKAEFSNMYDMLLQECVSNDVMCSYLHSLSDLDAHTELQCLYLHKVKECDCLAQKLSKQTESVSKEVYTELL